MNSTAPVAADAGEKRDLGLAVRRGFFGHCPNCGEGKLFRAYLKVTPHCPNCGEALYHQRADDAPPYITMLIVGHIVVGGVLVAEELWPQSPMWLGAFIWLWVTLGLSLTILPRVKGALVGYQWALRMHGFGGHEDDLG
ncbi:MAG TPA: DUF983 domain-containing protein [Roseiarcus sp.]|nr:DUF983 domain-containing protein [Roseiarcus sp.]